MDQAVQPVGQAALLTEDVARRLAGGEATLALPCRGVSMGPRFAAADYVVVRSRAMRPPCWGDVLLYRAGDGWVAHRAILTFTAAGRRWWVSKGDGCWWADRWPVADDEVVGIVKGFGVKDGETSLGGGREVIRSVGATLLGLCGLLVHPLDRTRLAPGGAFVPGERDAS